MVNPDSGPLGPDQPQTSGDAGGPKGGGPNQVPPASAGTTAPNPAPDTGPADRDPERFTRGTGAGPSVRTGTAADQADAEGRTRQRKRPDPHAVVTEWLRGNSSIRATDDNDFKRSAADLLTTLDNAGHEVTEKETP